MPRVAVLGGGISGLSACFHLERLGIKEITLFEAEARLGGKLMTIRHLDNLIEAAPDSIFTRQTEILKFIDDVGLTQELIEPVTRGFSIWLDGALRQIPPGLTRMGHVDPQALDAFPFLSSVSKREVLNERSVPPNQARDESVGDFFRRRFGFEFATKVAEPLFAGTHGGCAPELSMQALYPAFRAQERKYGSLACAHGEGETSALAKFVSFKGGLEDLVEKTASSLKSTDLRRRRVNRIGASHLGISVDEEEFDAVIVALPAHAAAKILPPELSEASCALSTITAASSIVATLRYEVSNETLGLYGTGFLTPESDDQPIRGATWSSQKWNFRSLPSNSLVRVFLQDSLGADEELLQTAVKAMSSMAKIEREPSYRRIDRWPRGLPQYRLGHVDLIEGIESSLRQKAPIFLAGQSYRGVGIPDCVRQGREAAEAVAAYC
jgi:oxygen-dependent protoporphyrinogen oxidase